MKKLLLLLLAIGLIAAVFNNGSFKQPQKMSDAKENGNTVASQKYQGTYQYSAVVDTHGVIPGFTNYYDYETNGNNIHKLWVIGDTILVAIDRADSVNAQVSNARRTVYQASTDGGATWFPDPVLVSQGGNAYPDMVPQILTGSRTVSISGRQFIGTARKGYVGTDILLGAGTFTVVTNGSLTGNGSDLFASRISESTVACAYINLYGTTSDSLWYVKFNTTTNAYSGNLLLTGNPSEIATNVRQYIASNSNQNIAVAWWFPTAPTKLLVKESTNGGTSFGATQTIITEGTVVNGNPVAPWFGGDLIYKPGTSTFMMAFNTLGPGNFAFISSCKLLFWSPGINGGNPVKIADHSNYPPMADTNLFNNGTSSEMVGYTYLSHPSLAYSNDGSKLFCVYVGTQLDSSSYSFYFHDIWESYSTNDGATWSAPVQLTNTANVDEVYPTIARTGNTSNQINVTYSISECPGSTSFTNTATPVCKVWHVLRSYNPTTGAEIIGIKNISSEVPKSFSLAQNYPNPFNPVTKIRFAVPKPTNVTINVYDIAGRLVRTLANDEFVTAGTKEVEFSANNLASGIYFYTLKADGFTATKKMMLVK
jgi:hypothetical protein